MKKTTTARTNTTIRIITIIIQAETTNTISRRHATLEVWSFEFFFTITNKIRFAWIQISANV